MSELSPRLEPPPSISRSEFLDAENHLEDDRRGSAPAMANPQPAAPIELEPDNDAPIELEPENDAQPAAPAESEPPDPEWPPPTEPPAWPPPGMVWPPIRGPLDLPDSRSRPPPSPPRPSRRLIGDVPIEADGIAIADDTKAEGGIHPSVLERSARPGPYTFGDFSDYTRPRIKT